MLFNSYPFLFVFLPLTLLAFFGLRRAGLLRASIAALTMASIAFYAYWKPLDTPILLGSIVFNYFTAGWLVRLDGRGSRWLLALGICGNLAVLFYFKYFNFIASNVAALSGVEFAARAIVMPIGISFFTFTQTAYLVDCFRSRSNERNFLHYALFVTIFPHLIAGPIIHHAQMRPQFDAIQRRPVDVEFIKMGIIIFIVGLAKKVLLADHLVVAADIVFNAADKGASCDAAAAWVGVLSYTLQIYFDFSGYSDMAIGLALLFGLRLPVNFNSPYKSRSIIEFWRRWHITLSTWLRDYLYIPLGGNRHGEWMRLRNIFITMLLGGIWHGAGWTFVIWGALHGGYIVVNHALQLRRQTGGVRQPDHAGVAAAKQASTLLLVMIAWVFFRAKSLGGALLLLRSMVGAGLRSPTAVEGAVAVAWIVVGAAIALFAPNTQELVRYTERLDKPLRVATQPFLAGLRSRNPGLTASPAMALLFGLLLAVSVAQLWRPTIFIYFNF